MYRFSHVTQKKEVKIGGSYVKCIGCWKCPDNLLALSAGLLAVHVSSHGRSGPYLEKCEDCAASDKGYCVHHGANNPRTVRSGCVTYSTKFIDAKRYVNKFSNHVPNATGQLMPSDIRALGRYIAATNDPFKICLFAMMMTACYLFLRSQEFSVMCDESFIQKLFVMSDEYIVDGLELKLRVKNTHGNRGSGTFCIWTYAYAHMHICICRLTHSICIDFPDIRQEDVSQRNIVLWSNDECPELDPIRILMAHLYLIGWKGGYLFPTEAEIRNPPADGIYKTHMTEAQMLDYFKVLYKTVLGREEKIDLHGFRKTAYLLLIFGGCLHIASLMLAANHKCAKVANRYLQDALALYQKCKVFCNREEYVGNVRNCYSNGGENAMRACAPGAKWQRPLHEIVKGFIEVRVGISPLDPRSKQPTYVYEQVQKWQKPTVKPEAALEVSRYAPHMPYAYGLLFFKYCICICYRQINANILY